MTAQAALAVAAVLAAAMSLAGSPAPATRLGPRLRSPSRWDRWRAVGGTALAGLAGVIAMRPLADQGVPVVPLAVAAAVVEVFRRRRRRARLERAGREQQRDDVQALRALAAELKSGLAPADALRVAAAGPSGSLMRERMLAAADVAGAGGDAAAALATGSAPASSLAGLAAAWSICQSTGARLAAPVSRIAAAATLDLRLRREADAAMAGARTSARLLAALPLAGAALGALSGTGAATVLLTSPAGQACLVIGAGLDLLGLTWLDRIAADPR